MRRHVTPALVAAVLAVAALVAAGCTPTTASGEPAWHAFSLTGWTPGASYQVESLTSAQGVATVHPPAGAPYEVYDNRGSIPQSLVDAGWAHVGDPDSRDGYTVYPYQASDAAQGKLYEVVTPTGQVYDYTHALAPGEELNNSFAAISPDGQWLVSGEWGTMNRLLVFPMPILNPSTSPTGGTLPLVATIQLSTPAVDVQGCTFTSGTRLLCTSDDSLPTYYPTAKPLLQVDLPAALGGSTVTASVTSLGELPQVSLCTGTFEVEGLDYDIDTATLRIVVVPPGLCEVQSDVYEYTPAP